MAKVAKEITVYINSNNENVIAVVESAPIAMNNGKIITIFGREWEVESISPILTRPHNIPDTLEAVISYEVRVKEPE